MKYPIYKIEITELEKRNVNDCLESTWISSHGKYINRFEQMLSDYCSTKYVTSVINGTAALHLVMLAANIGPGDEVIVPDFSYIATANAVLYVGATPIFIDVDIDTWNIDSKSLLKKITKKTKAIIAVDIFGNPANYDCLINICRQYKLLLISDSAEAFGAEYKNKKCGNLADISIFSFFGNKTITTGEGGAILTNEKKLFEYIKKLKNQGNSPQKKYYHDILGYNFRMTNIQAAIGCAQLERCEDILNQKNKIADTYKKYLSKHLVFQYISSKAKSSYWMVSGLLSDKEKRDSIIKYLSKLGIDTRPFFYPMHTMPYFNIVLNNPTTQMLSERGLCLPSYPSLKEKDIQFISKEIINFLED